MLADLVPAFQAVLLVVQSLQLPPRPQLQDLRQDRLQLWPDPWEPHGVSEKWIEITKWLMHSRSCVLSHGLLRRYEGKVVPHCSTFSLKIIVRLMCQGEMNSETLVISQYHWVDTPEQSAVLPIAALPLAALRSYRLQHLLINKHPSTVQCCNHEWDTGLELKFSGCSYQV